MECTYTSRAALPSGETHSAPNTAAGVRGTRDAIPAVMTPRALLFALCCSVAGCAGSQALDRSAEQHDANARALEAQNRYTDALREREAADDDRQDEERFARHDGDDAPHPLGIGR